MTIGIFVTARLGSTRLKRKHLLPAGGRPLIQWLLERIQSEFSESIEKMAAQVVIVSTPEEENLAFQQFSSLGVDLFQGSPSNIPLRHLQAAEHFGLSGIVSVDGDDILCAIEAMRAVFEGLASGSSGVRTEGLPFGMNAWGYSTSFLKECLQSHDKETLETGWGRIFPPEVFKVVSYEAPDYSKSLRFTLDYQEDYLFFKEVIESLPSKTVSSASWETLASHTLDNSLNELNMPRIVEYWDNFHKEKQSEQQANTTSGSDTP